MFGGISFSESNEMGRAEREAALKFVYEVKKMMNEAAQRSASGPVAGGM